MQVFTVVALTAVIASAAAAQGDAKKKWPDVNVVTVEGKDTTYDSALKDALRKAVERGAGQFIHSHTEVKDYAVILDEILSKSAGFITKYEVLKKRVDADALHHVTLKAWVSVKQVATEWGEIQILLQKKNKPRIMIIVGERLDRVKQSSAEVETAIEKKLLSNDFPLVDKGQFSEIQRKDLTSAAFDDNLSKIAAIGKRFGAELVITGNADALYDGPKDLYGIRTEWYGATCRAKVIRTDTAQIIHSDSATARKGSRTKLVAASKALKAAGDELAQKLQDGITKKWGREIVEGASIKLEVTGLSFKERSNLTKKLRKTKKVKSVQPRSYANKVAMYNIDITVLADKFAEILSEFKNPALEITEVTQNVIKVKIVRQKKDE